MKIEESQTPGKILIDCLRCGADFEIDDFRDDPFAEAIRLCFEHLRLCGKCSAELAEEEERRKRDARLAELVASLPGRIEAAGLPRNYIADRENGEYFTVPPVRAAAEWVWRHRQSHILLSGVTGTGKSTSACFAALLMLKSGAQVRYITLGDLLSLWRAARQSRDESADRKLLSRITGYDLCIIDECVGKYRISESGQEVLFEILERINSGRCRSRIWLLGNFYTGSIEAIFADPEPVRRRLQENFACGVIGRDGRVKTIKVYETKGETK